MKGKAHLKSKTSYFLICRLGKRTGGLLFFFFLSTFLYSQTLVGRAQIHIHEEAGFYINGEKIENAGKLQPEHSPKARIYVSTGTIVTNLDSENIEIIKVKAVKPLPTVKPQKIAKSVKVQGLKPSETKEKKIDKPVIITLKPAPAQDILRQANGNSIVAAPVQNFQQKQFSADIYGHWNTLLASFPENFFSPVPNRFSSYKLTSFSVRPPPAV